MRAYEWKESEIGKNGIQAYELMRLDVMDLVKKNRGSALEKTANANRNDWLE
jgi:hypothetical protein